MTKRVFKFVTILAFSLTAVVICALLFLPRDFFSPPKEEVRQTKVVIPQATGGRANPAELRNGQNGEEIGARIELNAGESIISVLTRDFDGDSRDEQVIAFRNLQEIDTPIFITYVDFVDGQDKRLWTAPSAATRPGTLMLYSEDLIGDGGICILAAGMNGSGEQTLTVFRKNGYPEAAGARSPMESRSMIEPFSKIAEFIIEGSIAVQEQNYIQGGGRSLSIATYGRDYESSNLLDQIELTYIFNQANGLYEQARVVKIPGSQIEQRRVRELLTGAPEHFETFIDGLWYMDSAGEDQYVYFNIANREMIFYNNDSEEVFSWQDSNPTRYGLHIIGRNNSLTKLRRTVNVELESLESIRLRVFQDVYLRSGPGTIWDGSYRRVKSLETAQKTQLTPPHPAGAYAGPEGRVSFFSDGSYELVSGFGQDENIERGKYVFFTMGDNELLEMRPEGRPQTGQAQSGREIFKVQRSETPEQEMLILTRVHIGTRGIQELHETPVSLIKS
jgi:hypothetical protein